jgi:hypothetical protein
MYISRLSQTSESLLDAPNPEYIRVKMAVERFSLPRTKFYELIKAGKIASVSLREEGQKKATRLLSVESIRRFLEARTEGGEE